MSTTATAAPAAVPITCAKLRLRVMPAKGRLMMITVISAHLGCSRSKMNARYRHSRPATMVRKVKSNTPRPGLRASLK